MATTTEIIQQLVEAVNDLNIRVTSLDNQLNSLTYTVNSVNNNATSGINSLTLSVNSLIVEDNELHDEIHAVNESLINTYSYLMNTTNNLNSLGNSYLDLSYTVNVNRTDMDNEDVELHNEIHSFTEGINTYISYNTSNIDGIKNYLTAVPQHVLLSEEEYEYLPNPDPVKYYFVYEED